jgi:hypothetical protein
MYHFAAAMADKIPATQSNENFQVTRWVWSFTMHVFYPHSYVRQAAGVASLHSSANSMEKVAIDVSIGKLESD